MTLQCPDYIRNSGVVGAPLSFEWNDDIALDHLGSKDENPRLYRAIDECSFKAKVAINALVVEWILWRFVGQTEISDGLLRAEAAWAAVIHPLYARRLAFKLNNGRDPARGVVEMALAVLDRAQIRNTKGSIHLAEMVVKEAMLARRVAPDTKAFDAWVSDVVRRTVSVFPRSGPYDRTTEVYDAAHEKPVPRQFFDPSFQYSGAAVDQALRDFLKGLDPGANPYLRTADEIRAEGFPGTPYQW